MYCTAIENPKARKPHKCTSCGEEIPTGERYVRWRSFDDGSAFTNKMHIECYSMHDYEGGAWLYDLFSYDRPIPGA